MNIEYIIAYIDRAGIGVFFVLPFVALGFAIYSLVKAVQSKRYTTFWYRLLLFFGVLFCAAGWLLNFGLGRAVLSIVGIVHILLFFIVSLRASNAMEPKDDLSKYTKWACLTSFPAYLLMPDSATGELYAFLGLLKELAGVPEIIFNLCRIISIFSLVVNIIFIILQIKEMRY